MRNNSNLISTLLILIQPTCYYSKGRGIRCSNNQPPTIIGLQLLVHFSNYDANRTIAFTRHLTVTDVRPSEWWHFVHRCFIGGYYYHHQVAGAILPYLGRSLNPEYGGSIFLRIVCGLLPNYTSLHPSRQFSSYSGHLSRLRAFKLYVLYFLLQFVAGRRQLKEYTLFSSFLHSVASI
jgi:hypothetical protein